MADVLWELLALAADNRAGAAIRWTNLMMTQTVAIEVVFVTREVVLLSSESSYRQRCFFQFEAKCLEGNVVALTVTGG